MTIKSAVILAAGRGSRLISLTKTRSKAMLPITGKPMIERVMSPFISSGIEDFIIVVNPNDQQILDHFRDANNSDRKIKFVTQDYPTGTAHALAATAPFLNQDFMISACDNLVPAAHVREVINHWNAHQPLNGILSLLLVGKEKIFSSALVEMNNNYITRIIEKPTTDSAPSNISSIPLYCFSPRILNYLQDVQLSKRGEYELQDAIQMLITQDGFVSGLFTKHRLTVTCPDDLLYVNKWYLNQYQHRIEKIPKNFDISSKFLSPVHIADDSTIGRYCVIGPNVFIESGSTIEDFVTISDSVVLQGARVLQGSCVKDQIIN
jgi:glucose-1-phosphate thymidylyltransferase